MPVQMFALAVVIGDAMAGIEFQAAGDEHSGQGRFESGRNYTLGAYGNSLLRDGRPDTVMRFNWAPPLVVHAKLVLLGLQWWSISTYL